MAQWNTAMQKRRKWLRNKRRYPAWRKLGDEQCLPGGDGSVLTWRWFLPAIERPGISVEVAY